MLDLFSAAAGGWSLGMHRAGFTTMAACEAVEWRRTLYSQNNPGVKVYDDVCTLTAKRLLDDFGRLPSVIVGSPPCQDISSANTKGKGVEGARSGLFFEAVRLIGEVRPRWFALENSANLRTRGADAVIAALEGIDYPCWPVVVRASNIGANHERPRSWLIGCDLAQVADYQHSKGVGHEGWRTRRHRQDGDGSAHAPHANSDGEHAQSEHGKMAELSGMEGNRRGQSNAADAHQDQVRQPELPRGPEPQTSITGQLDRPEFTRTTPDPDQAGQADGRMEPSLRQEEIADHGCGDGRRHDGSRAGQVAVRPDDRGNTSAGEPLWSLEDLAARIWLDDGLPARVAGTRVAVGGPRGTTAASLIVEAYGDAVVPQIPEAIGRAILRVERAMEALTS